LTGECGLLNAEMVEQLAQIFDERIRPWPIRDVARHPEASMVEGDAAKMLRQYRHLLPPTQMASAGAVREHECRTFAVNLVI
jgi:hypothetical protein